MNRKNTVTPDSLVKFKEPQSAKVHQPLTRQVKVYFFKPNKFPQCSPFRYHQLGFLE
jgi:hypothetical protein